MTRFLALALSTASFAALGFLPAPSSALAGDEILRIETTYVAADGYKPNRKDPADRLAKPQPAELDLTTTPPPGTGRVPAGRERFYGSLDVGGKALPFVMAVQEGDQGVLVFGGTEHREAGRAGKSQGRPVVRWTFSALSLGEAHVDLAVNAMPPEYQAVLVKDGPLPIALSPSPKAGTRLFSDKTQATAFGEADGLDLAFVREGSQRLTLLLDRNENGVIGESGEVIPMPVAGQDGDTMYWQVEGLAMPSGAAGMALQETAGVAKGFARPSGARRGQAPVGARTFHLHLLDADLDGRYDSKGDLWWFGPIENLQQVRRLTPDAMIEAGEPIFIDGTGWRLVSVDDGGGAVVMSDPNAGSVSEYFHRRAERVNHDRWWPQFKAEALVFRQAQNMDPARPQATSRVAWLHDVDVVAALEAAKRENKPVLVDFEADWCSWCKRFDYYVYGDQEVDALLKSFVRVKINKEFHFSGDFGRLGGKGLPFLVFLRPDGTPIEMMLPDAHGKATKCSGPPGFQPPQVFAKTLRTALQAWQGR